MSSGDENKTDMKELMDKFNKYAKHVKLVLTKLEEIEKNIDSAVKPANADDDKVQKLKKHVQRRASAVLLVRMKANRDSI